LPKVAFTPNLQRHLDCPPVEVAGGTLREVLESVFEANPRVRGYILDDRAELRKHVAVFVDGNLIRNRTDLEIPVEESSEVYIGQALSGG